MTLFKCKMCGADLRIAEGSTIAECEYCGARQTVPRDADGNLQTLFNRANALRIKSEFDKAESIYEKIIRADGTQAEAYWGLILCRYGIEYVDDPVTDRKVPTCHRTSFDPIVTDDDYRSALKYADASQRALYEEQAREIDRIQKEILALAQQEESYDIFICYKETDAAGRRTRDSVIANDIYHLLTQEGFKVFYAAITLEGKLGSAYEPIIFAALHSAKVMLAIGTRPEHFSAVWVKNEWSRFLKIMSKDRSRLLIPCYRDMDAYELPDEFAHLQTYDMSRIGFINDVVRGIKKVIPKEEARESAVTEEDSYADVAAAQASPLLRRAFLFLEDGDFTAADEYFEKVLDIDPEQAQAYLGKMLVSLRVKKQSELCNCEEPFDDNAHYRKVLRFADRALKDSLARDIEYINTRNKNARMEGIYREAVQIMEAAETEQAYREAAEIFASIADYKDSSQLSMTCLRSAEGIHKDVLLAAARAEMANAARVESLDDRIAVYREIIPALLPLVGWKDAGDLLHTCEHEIETLTLRAEEERLERERRVREERREQERRAEEERRERERRAEEERQKQEILAEADRRERERRIEAERREQERLAEEARLERERRAEAERQKQERRVEEERQKQERRAEKERLERERRAEKERLEREEREEAERLEREEREEAERLEREEREEEERLERERQERLHQKRIAARERRPKLIATLAISMGCLALVIGLLWNTVIVRALNYNKAMKLMQQRSYAEAITVLDEASGYRDSEEKRKECQKSLIGLRFLEAVALVDAKRYDDARALLNTYANYAGYPEAYAAIESAILESQYQTAVFLMNGKNYREALSIFTALGTYQDSVQKMNECLAALQNAG